MAWSTSIIGLYRSAQKRINLPFAVLIGSILLALVLRIWGLKFGLPYAYHIDEPTYISAAVNLGTGVIGRQPNPTGFSNMLLVEYGTYYVLGRIAGIFQSLSHFESIYRANISNFLILSRLTSALLGTLNVYVIYRLGEAVRGRTTGLISAAILAGAFLHVRDSHYGVPDVAMTFFVSLSVLWCQLSLGKESWEYFFAALAAGGFAITVKWTAWPVGITLILTAISLSVSGRFSFRRQKQLLTRRFAAGILTLLVGLLLGAFQMLLNPKPFIEYAFLELSAGEGGGFAQWQIDEVSGWWFFVKTLAYGIGYGSLILGIAGVFTFAFSCISKREPWKLAIVTSFPLAYYIVMGSTRHYFARYALPILPFVVLFAAQLLGNLWSDDKWIRSRKLRKYLTAGLFIAALGQPLVSSIRHDFLLTRDDTRTLAKQWIEANIDENARIALDWPIHGPPLSTREKPVPDSRRQYVVTHIGGTGLSEHALDWYVEQKYDYLITSSFITEIELVDPDWSARRKRFYAALDDSLELVKVIRPTDRARDPDFIFAELFGPATSLWQRDRPGPTIKIYRLVDEMGTS